MHAAPLSITTLYTQIEQASNKEMACAISKAFEQLETNQREMSTQITQEVLKEVKIEDLATKADLNELRADFKELRADFNELRADFNEFRVTTKTDLKTLELKMSDQKLELHKAISSSKWQVLGGMAVLLFVQLTGKHFGLF
jgi:ABC-type phosphate transport system auxiliary subunit